MSAVKSGRRPYRSRRRKEQAESTRAAILDAAGRLFSERGYTGTTVEAIAEAAGVAAVTVYAAFGSKRALLARLVGIAVTGDERPQPVYERERAQAVMRKPDQRRQVAMFAPHMAQIMERVSPLFEVMDHASPVAPEIVDLRQQILRSRLEGMRAFVRALARNGPLRAALSEADAAETVWAITSAQLHRLLTRELGWDRARYSAWLADTLSAALLPDQPPP